MDETKNGYNDCYAEYQDDVFNYLAIGNSMVVHMKCDYWWNTCGMASSSVENDYYHIVTRELEDRYGLVCSSVCNLSTWEMLSTDRAEAAELLIPYLSDKLNLITIQLGENVNDLATFESDYEFLISYVQNKAPNAQIIIVGDFWNKNNRNEIKQKVAEKKVCIL